MTHSKSNKAFYDRINVLAGTNQKSKNINENISRTLINHEITNDGTILGIIKENHHYFIKKANKKENLNESDFIYIGGLENKNDHRYDSVSEAEKQRNMYIKSLNEAFSLDIDENKESINENNQVNEKIDNPFEYLKNRVKKEKINIAENSEKKFKTSLKPTNDTNNKSNGLLNETALNAIHKAMGKLNESEIISTTDSEIKDTDKVSEKKGKEKPQAPIDDSNTKIEADKNKGTDKIPEKPKTGDDLITADSEINASESPVNQINATKEQAQAPINDTNAKIEADKNNTNKGTTEKTENESDDIVSENKDIVTADSDIKDSDNITKKKNIEKPEAPYNSYNQPNKGQTDGNKKGTELKPKESKKDVVAEGDDLITADSEINDVDIISNKSDKKEDAQAPINDKNAKGQADKNDINSGTTEEPKKESNAIVNEGDDLITADSKVNDTDVIANKSDKKEEPQAPINDKNAKTEADKNDINSGTTEEPKKESNAIVNENKIKEDENDGEDELAAAASALDDLEVADVTADAVETEPAPEMDVAPEETIPEDQPEIDDTPEETVPEDIPSDDDKGEDDFSKEIQKLVGKLGQVVRDNDVSPDQTKSALNSVISAFKSELGDLDVEERKEMSDKILKAQSGISDGDSKEQTTETNNGEENLSNISGLEKDAETAIDQKITDLSDNGEETVEEDVNCVECGSFKNYMESRGYTNESIGECSAMEMANLISGYANGYNNDQNNGDFENIAIYITPEVEKELGGYGHNEFIEQLKPYVANVSEDQKLKFGTFEPTITDFDEGEDNEIEKTPEEQSKNSEETDDYIVDPNRTIGGNANFIGGADIMGVGVVKPDGAKTKSVDVDLESGKVNVTMSESEKKLRKYIKNRIEELEGKRTPSLNENKKSNTLKKLDKKIEVQFDSFKKIINENGDINEIFGFSAKEKFEKLSPTDSSSIEKLFNDVFRDILINPRMGIIKRLASQTQPDEKYNILKQGYDTDELKGTLRIDNNQLVYAPKSVKDIATHSEFAGGGTQGKTRLGGV